MALGYHDMVLANAILGSGGLYKWDGGKQIELWAIPLQVKHGSGLGCWKGCLFEAGLVEDCTVDNVGSPLSLGRSVCFQRGFNPSKPGLRALDPPY